MKCRPWERQENETKPAFEAFVLYRDMGTKRSIRRVGQELGKSRALVERWSTKNHWIDRVQAYDDYLDKEAQKVAVREYKAMNQRHIETAKLLQTKALKALKDMPDDALSPKYILDYLTKAMELERLSLKEKAAPESTITGEDDSEIEDMISIRKAVFGE